MRTQTLTTRVGAALASEPRLDAGAITVSDDGCVITLGGSVNSPAERVSARNAALRVDEFHGLAMDIEVKRPEGEGWGDEAIAKDAVIWLEREPRIAGERLQVAVDGGIVTLTGRVRHAEQRLSASSAVHEARGVLGVVNDITLSPPAPQTSPRATSRFLSARSVMKRAWPAPGDYGSTMPV